MCSYMYSRYCAARLLYSVYACAPVCTCILFVLPSLALTNLFMYYRAGSTYYGQFYLVSVVYVQHIPDLSIKIRYC